MAKVLHIEGLKPIRELVREVLQNHFERQVQVTPVMNLEEGMGQLAKEYFPLVILDDEQLIGSPEQKIKFLWEFAIGIPVILTTQPWMKEGWLSCGELAERNIVAILQKPFHLNDLIGAVKLGLEDKHFRNFYTVVERTRDWSEGDAKLLREILEKATPGQAVTIFSDDSCPKTIVVHPLVPTNWITTFYDGGVVARYANDRTCPFPASL